LTSLCLGGEDLRDLYVVTGSQGGPRENCASVIKTRVDISGQPNRRPASPSDKAPRAVYAQSPGVT
jgi:hypothetical protein